MNFQHLKILFVDDMSTVQKVFTQKVSKLGIYSVVSKSDSLSALTYLEENIDQPTKIDIVFCDWHMPGGDGNLLLDKIRGHKNEDLVWTKFIMVTGSEEKIAKAILNGANHIIQKPFQSDKILNCLNLTYR